MSLVPDMDAEYFSKCRGEFSTYSDIAFEKHLKTLYSAVQRIPSAIQQTYSGQLKTWFPNYVKNRLKRHRPVKAMLHTKPNPTQKSRICTAGSNLNTSP